MPFGLNLRRSDYGILAGLLLFSLVSGAIFMPVTDRGMLLLVDRFTNFMALFAILGTLVPLYLASVTWGGQIGRNLQVIGVGLVLFMISVIPHVEWHVAGSPNPLGPALYSLSSAWWAGFFHILTVVSWIVMIFGFYLFYSLGKPQGGDA